MQVMIFPSCLLLVLKPQNFHQRKNFNSTIIINSELFNALLGFMNAQLGNLPWKIEIIIITNIRNSNFNGYCLISVSAKWYFHAIKPEGKIKNKLTIVNIKNLKAKNDFVLGLLETLFSLWSLRDPWNFLIWF